MCSIYIDNISGWFCELIAKIAEIYSNWFIENISVEIAPSLFAIFMDWMASWIERNYFVGLSNGIFNWIEQAADIPVETS